MIYLFTSQQALPTTKLIRKANKLEFVFELVSMKMRIIQTCAVIVEYVTPPSYTIITVHVRWNSLCKKSQAKGAKIKAREITLTIKLFYPENLPASDDDGFCGSFWRYDNSYVLCTLSTSFSPNFNKDLFEWYMVTGNLKHFSTTLLSFGVHKIRSWASKSNYLCVTESLHVLLL